LLEPILATSLFSFSFILSSLSPELKEDKMKEKLNKEVAKIGSSNVDHGNLNAIEAVSMSIVAILAITAGTIYGGMLF